ncbi:DUF1573 domain-containing protein [Luteibaculum oceani]|uniref:DUF1573 domain-containing protein n=1 Tax=Luteibaculum oceani TaxID=1294296 RepID=A0A5C6V9W6_9FLAO|nr:DUF1573 domain-containing protein [Luteibaculum oceani]TXC81610.1 DUF1573 domain-containing protein [Luteibaculum oceani]
MKKVLGLVALVLMVFGAQAQNTVATGPQISVDKEVHDYGTIEKGADPYCYFEVKNTGTEPLVISNAKGSCGCTVPEWSREPVMPGKSTKIKVRYDTKRVGPINKSVTLTSNAVNEPTMVLRIKGNVLNAPAAEAPEKKISEGVPVEKN